MAQEHGPPIPNQTYEPTSPVSGLQQWQAPGALKKRCKASLAVSFGTQSTL